MNSLDIEKRIKTLEARLASTKFNYENSPWDMGPRYRREIEQIEGDLRALREQLKSVPLADGADQAPAGSSHPQVAAGADMTVSQAEEILFRPFVDDETMLAACRIVDQHTRHATCRDIAREIIRQFEEKIIEA